MPKYIVVSQLAEDDYGTTPIWARTAEEAKALIVERYAQWGKAVAIYSCVPENYADDDEA